MGQEKDIPKLKKKHHKNRKPIKQAVIQTPSRPKKTTSKLKKHHRALILAILAILANLPSGTKTDSLDLPFLPPSFTETAQYLNWLYVDPADQGVLYFFGGRFNQGTTQKSDLYLYHLYYQHSEQDYTTADSFLKTPPAQHTQKAKIGTETDNSQKLLKFSKAGFYAISKATGKILGLNREQLIGSNSPPDPDYDKFFTFEKAGDNDYDLAKRVEILRNTADQQFDVDLLAPGGPENRDYLYTDFVQTNRIQLFLRLNRNNRNAGLVVEDSSPDPVVSFYSYSDSSQKFMNCHFLEPGKCLGMFIYVNDNYLRAIVMKRDDLATPPKFEPSGNEGYSNYGIGTLVDQYTEKIEYISSITVNNNHPSPGSLKSHLVVCLKKGNFYFLVVLTYRSNPPDITKRVVGFALPLHDIACLTLVNIVESPTHFYMGFQQKSTKKNKIGAFRADFTTYNLELLREMEDPNLAKPETLQLYRDTNSNIFISFARDLNKADYEPRIYFKYAFSAPVIVPVCSIPNCQICLHGNKCGGCKPRYYVDASKACSKCSLQFSGCDLCLSGACFKCNAAQGWTLVDTEQKKYSTMGCQKAGSCAAQQTLFKGVCTACPNNCEECYQRLDTDPEPSCSKCFQGSGLVVDPATRQCAAPPHNQAQGAASCASNEFFDSFSSLCQSCSPSCLTCVGGAENCSSCSPTAVLKYLYSSSCVQKCPNGFVQNPANRVCEACSEACATCEGQPGTCSDCSAEYDKIVGSNSVQCLKKCQKGFFRNSGSLQCVQCTENCFECTSTTVCKACNPGFQLGLPGTPNAGKCILIDCPEKEYRPASPGQTEPCKACPQGCLTCTGPKNCQKCEGGYKMSKSTNLCEKQCPVTTVLSINDQGTQVCLGCVQGCFECQNQPENCAKCSEGYFMNSTKSCQLECVQGEAWVPPNNCEACPDVCSRCLDVSKDCFENIEFVFFEAPEDELGHDLTLWANVYKLVNGVREPMDVSVLKKSKNLNFLFDLKIEIPGKGNTTEGSIQYKELDSSLEWSPTHQKIVLKAKIPKNFKTPKTYKIQVTPSAKEVTTTHKDTTWQFFIPKTTPTTQEYKITHITDENRLKQAETSGKAFSAVTDSSSYVINYGSLITSLINIDQSGSMLKMAQSTKLMSRMRLMGVNFGVYLQQFMDYAALSFDKPSDFSKDDFERRSPSRQGKFSEKGTSLSLIEARFRLPVFLYIGVSGLGWALWVVLCLMEEFETMNRTFLRVFSKVKNVQFSLFNMVVLDVAFFGLRSMVHTRGEVMKRGYFVALVCMFLAFLDFFGVVRSLVDFGAEMRSEGEKEGLDSLEFQLVVSSMMARGGNVVHKLQKKRLKTLKKFYSEEEMTSLLKIHPKITDKYTKKINIKKTANYHKRSNPAIKQAISELNPTTNTASHLPVLFEHLAFLSKTIIYQVLLVSLPRSPQLQIVLLFCVEVSYLTVIITNYRKYKHLRSLILFIAKLPLSAFLLILLILAGKFSFSETIEKRGGARRAVPPSVGLQMIGVVLILASVVVEYFLMFYKLFLSLREVLSKKKNSVGVKKGSDGKIRTAEDGLGGIEHIPAEGVNRRRNAVFVAPGQNGDGSKPLEMPKQDKIFYFWERNEDVEEHFQEESAPLNLNNKPLGGLGGFMGLRNKRHRKGKKHQNFKNKHKKGAKGFKKGPRKLPNHSKKPQKRQKRPLLEESLKQSNLASWAHPDDLGLPIADLSDYEREIGIHNEPEATIHEEEAENGSLEFNFNRR